MALRAMCWRSVGAARAPRCPPRAAGATRTPCTNAARPSGRHTPARLGRYAPSLRAGRPLPAIPPPGRGSDSHKGTHAAGVCVAPANGRFHSLRSALPRGVCAHMVLRTMCRRSGGAARAPRRPPRGGSRTRCAMAPPSLRDARVLKGGHLCAPLSRPGAPLRVAIPPPGRGSDSRPLSSPSKTRAVGFHGRRPS